MKLSLDCLTLTDTLPMELIASAAAAGADLVSLWTNPPAPFPKMVLSRDMANTCMSMMADHGIGVHSIEVFDLSSESVVRAYRPALELGARLGGKAAAAINLTNPDRACVVDLLGIFVELAKDAGLAVNIEAVAMGHTRTLAEGRDLIRDAGVDAGLIFDTLHLVRSGCTIEDLRAIDPSLIRYVQINDGPAEKPVAEWGFEGGCDRLYPGEGVFPLVELLRDTPTDIPWAIETPSLPRVRRGISPKGQAIEAMAALKKLLGQVGLKDFA